GFRRVQLSYPLFWIRFFRRGKGPVPLSPLQGEDPVGDSFGRDFLFQKGTGFGIEQFFPRFFREAEDGRHLFFVIVGGPEEEKKRQAEEEPDQRGHHGAPQNDGQGQADELTAKAGRRIYFSQRYPIPQTVVMGFSPGSAA